MGQHGLRGSALACVRQGGGGSTAAPSVSEDEAASVDIDAHGTEQLLMANGDEGTVAEGLKLSPRHLPSGLRNERSRRRSSAKRAYHTTFATLIL